MSTEPVRQSADRGEDMLRRASSRGRRRVRVLAADGHPLYRDAMTRAIRERPELELVAEAADGRGALDAISSQEPDVAVIERDLPGLNGEQVLNAVDRDGLGTRVVLITAEPASDGVYLAIANGAAGYLTKEAEARDICDAITAVARGQTILAPELQAGIAGEIRLRAVDERPFMSDREQEVLKLIASGMTAPQIARSIHLSTATIKTHLQHIYDKLGVSERAAAVAEAMRRGLLE
jgi:two-component system, NarL family, nitrate/nitrite response regulator NarL